MKKFALPSFQATLITQGLNDSAGWAQMPMLPLSSLPQSLVSV